MTECRRVKDTEVSGLGGSFRGGGCPWLSVPNGGGGVKAWKMVGKEAVSRVARVSVVEAEEKEAKVWDPGDPGKGPINSGVSVIWGTAQNLVCWNLRTDS